MPSTPGTAMNPYGDNYGSPGGVASDTMSVAAAAAGTGGVSGETAKQSGGVTTSDPGASPTRSAQSQQGFDQSVDHDPNARNTTNKPGERLDASSSGLVVSVQSNSANVRALIPQGLA